MVHPTGAQFPGPNAQLPLHELRYNTPFWHLSGICPGLRPQQQLDSLEAHDHIALQEALAHGIRPPAPIASAVHMLTCVPGALASPQTVSDSWLLFPIASARIETVHPTQPILHLSHRRPIFSDRFDFYYIRSFREAAGRNPNNATTVIPRPYTFSQATNRFLGPEPPQPQPGDFILEELLQGIPPLPPTTATVATHLNSHTNTHTPPRTPPHRIYHPDRSPGNHKHHPSLH